MQWIKQHLLSAPHFYRLSTRLLPWISVITAILLIYGVIGGLFIAPADYQQGDGFRIIYVHVPSALLAMAIYSFMALCAVGVLVLRLKLASLALINSARIGVWFTFLALITGSLWGKPMWGTYWIWDARLTSMLVLLFLYIGIIALNDAIAERITREKSVALLALAGFINIPIIHYSVVWWSTLHQGSTITKLHPSIASSMLAPLLAMLAGFLGLFALLLILRMGAELQQQVTHD
ncbi:MAG: heme ABC transporter permease [Legionellales bacterium]|nr:heme ABC transporter permease [Legionellales bacterium]|tara:strand:+ start:22360 stop:23064 length:705 start_codon:yes stop_codon:yes gene_type:complete